MFGSRSFLRGRGGFGLLGLGILLILTGSLFAQEGGQPKGLQQLNFLMGEWIGDGSGNPGQGIGGFSFSYDLQNTVLVRKNYAEYPATENKPAFRHEDLTVIYHAPDDTLRAVYFDNEGHVIHYVVEPGDDGRSATFISAPAEQNARYRLCYTTTNENEVAIHFEIAPPGQPEAFSMYLEATAHKK